MYSLSLKIIIAQLIFLVFVSSLQIVLTRHENRLFVSVLQELHQEDAELIDSCQEIQLEIISLTKHHHVERIAREELKMIKPKNIIVITP
ncbi:MAG: cell division protein FtsL [Thiomargarita sp.]|nr:cell division protein FtsL [Thiomargarita sp.]